MAGIFTQRIWQPYICQPNELKREVKKKTGEVKRKATQKSGGGHGPPRPPLESPLGNTGIIDPELLVQSRGRRNRTAPLFRHKG